MIPCLSTLQKVLPRRARSSILDPRPNAQVSHSSNVLFRNEDSMLTPAEFGKRHPQFKKTFPYRGEFVSRSHAFYAKCPLDGAQIDIGIRGSLLPADALKLYEMAFFSRGRILELGCNQGLSTNIMAGARRDAGVDEVIETVDLEQHLCDTTTRALRENRLDHLVEVYCDDALAYCAEGIELGRNYEFAFIDHSHAYDLVLGVADKLERLLIPGGFCLFHDYNDRRNTKAEDLDYGVSQAVDLAMRESHFEFFGIFGCSALFRRPLA